MSKSAGKTETLVGGYNRVDVEYKGVDWIQLVQVSSQWLSAATQF